MAVTVSDDQSVEQLVLTCLEFGDRRPHLGPVPGHGVGMALGIAVVEAGPWGLGHESAPLQIIGLVGQVGVLLVDDSQFIAQRSQSLAHLPQSTFDPAVAHRPRCYAAVGKTALMNWPNGPGGVDEWGIADGYHDIDGVWHATPDETRDALRMAVGTPVPLPLRWFVQAGYPAPLWSPADLRLSDGTILTGVTSLPADLPWGWHELHPCDGGPMTEVVVHPARCPDPGRRAGVAVQIHELWSDGTWETGDLTDVARLAARIRLHGGEALLLSPLHALLPGRDVDPSPYSPSSRRWRHPLLARPPGAPPPQAVPEPGRLVERQRAWAAAQDALDQAFAAVLPGSAEDLAWRRWALAQGDAVVRFARWSVVAERFGTPWQHWPSEFRHPSGEGWCLFTPGSDLSRRADRHAWAQWRVSEALAACRVDQVGLIADMAVGFHPGGFDAWDLQDTVATGVTIGAPPDPFSTMGQDWGLPPLKPGVLAAQRFEPWLASVRAAMQYADGLRLDHVMGLFRQFWIPPGGSPADGAYVRFPGHEMMALLALEACRGESFVIGEDLGTVEPQVRELMHHRRVLGTRVAWFEPDPRPASWSVDTLATLTTHDLPTLAGVWNTADEGDGELGRRLAAVAGVDDGERLAAREVIDAAHRALLAGPSCVRLVTADDLCLSEQRPNLPGVVGPPSWCVRLPCSVDEIPLGVLEHGTVTR